MTIAEAVKEKDAASNKVIAIKMASNGTSNRIAGEIIREQKKNEEKKSNTAL